MIDHDRLFKELLTTFFIEFLELFLPEVAAFVEPGSLLALDKELFTDVTIGETFETDVLMQAQFRGQEAWFLIHVEPQSYSQANFDERMFRYFAQLYLKHRRPIYPIALFSYDSPQRKETDTFQIAFPDKTVLQFNYVVIQLNQFSWRDYLNRPNPVASALMAKMKIEPQDRPKVKLACLRMLAGLKLNPAYKQLISRFVDIYLPLNPTEKQTFEVDLGKVSGEEKEEVMDMMTSWQREGLEQGLEEGLKLGVERGKLALLMGLLNHRFGELEPSLDAKVKALSGNQIEDLSIALLDFTSVTNLVTWLDNR